MTLSLTKNQEKILEVFEIKHPAAFLFHFPQRYEIYEEKSMDAWKPGDRLLILAELVDPFRHKHFSRAFTVTEFSVRDQFGQILRVSAYNQAFLDAKNYRDGLTLYAHIDKKGRLIADKIRRYNVDAERIIPIYPSKQKISQYHLRLLMKKLLQSFELFDILDADYQKERQLLSRQEALKEIHFPRSKKRLAKALRSLKYEEFLVYQLSALLFKEQKGVSKNVKMSEAVATLPFQLRPDQREVLEAMLQDARSDQQMRRLLQGDVGSGKTIVSFLLAMSYIQASYQVAFLVPTEALAFQHYASFQALFPEEKIALINKDSSEETMEALASGHYQIALGTHRLFSEKTKYHNLGLVIIDEQHRFGVKQREALIAKGDRPDLLMLSATPIPQTLAQSIFMDLDVSTLDFYRQGRVETHLLKENSAQSLMPYLKDVLEAKEQIYVVCPAVDQGERRGVRNVLDIEKEFKKIFGSSNVQALHGQMSSEEKEKILEAFSQNKLPILVSTSLIEVGIDVHNANTMLIYNAEQFGLASLHQMRGRVGRGEKKGHCFLLSDHKSEESGTRLEALVEYDDGFKLSEIDLKTRGMGDLLGERQAGLPKFYLVDFTEDLSILQETQRDAAMIIENKEAYSFLLKHVQKVEERKE